MPDFAAARHHMVQNQLEPNRVNDMRVASAMEAIPRERFVPEVMAGVAYLDEDIEIAPGRYLMEPMVFARLLQSADTQGGEIALDIGCVTGYSAAVLASLVGTVVAVEADEDLAAKATENLTALEADNAVVMVGDHAAGYAGQGPYDVIVIEGQVPEVPSALSDQLTDGGRLVAVIGSGNVGRLVRITRSGDNLLQEELFDAMLPPLTGFDQPEKFSF
ncbi:MAG: protein-L-isoaspartate O-methyltransferase [Alphaproteobacteria bacterium]|jgi:protein-L-isoaspartate(D-aspartate) O-methyltransferase|nr:protein-L-isoaspartate O-methyltransferase [Alphaproteobacteria bacterium]MBT4966850.1 protein-L-isoaspartate O-methyltransferase [Alphaproteobacteria bacterium]MBT5919015.1 protein-L-isoaspartate O-methyltransferase [Alphaproteobacteria bacterium]MBT6388036.1 protein-L-isoaspartate O-methyltransferase [Alphaproteobacteria bacterium]